MITFSSRPIGPRAMAAPKWWRPAEPPNWAALDRKIAEMERQVRQYPPKRKEPRMSPTRKIDAAEVYARRAAEAAASHQGEPAAGPRPRRPRTIQDLVREFYGPDGTS